MKKTEHFLIIISIIALNIFIFHTKTSAEAGKTGTYIIMNAYQKRTPHDCATTTPSSKYKGRRITVKDDTSGKVIDRGYMLSYGCQ